MQSNIVLDYDKELFWPIEERDALKVFDDIMDCNDSSIVVGVVNKRFLSQRRNGVSLNELMHSDESKKNDSFTPSDVFIDGQIALNGREEQTEYTVNEKIVATAWKEVLGFEAYGIHDSFFDMGGDSLKVRSVYRRLNDIYPDKLTIVDLFDNPTIYQLARFLSETKKEKDEGDIAGIGSQLNSLISELKEGKHSIEEAIMKYEQLF